LIWNKAYKGEKIQNSYMFIPPMFFISIEIMDTFRGGLLSGKDLLSYVQYV